MQVLYNELAKYFDSIAEASLVDTKAEIAFLETIFIKQNVRSVLDIACGTGRHSVELAQKGYKVVGVDYSEKLLEIARTKIELSNLEFLHQDVANLELDNKFDAAICMWSTFGELPYKKMLTRLSKTLNPGAIFIIDVTFFVEVPKASSRKVFTSIANGETVKTEVNESYEGITRVRDIVNFVNGQKYYDHSEMDVFTESGFVELLGRYNFRHAETYYDYSVSRSKEPKRIQLVFVYVED